MSSVLPVSVLLTNSGLVTGVTMTEAGYSNPLCSGTVRARVIWRACQAVVLAHMVPDDARRERSGDGAGLVEAERWPLNSPISRFDSRRPPQPLIALCF